MALRLEPEGGITRVSLKNARKLLEARGVPDVIHIHYDPFPAPGVGWYQVDAWWGTIRHTFEGFSWGYSGEGPRGLDEFFRMLGILVPYAEIVKWPQDLLARIPRTFEIRRTGIRKEWRPGHSAGLVFWKGVHYGRSE